MTEFITLAYNGIFGLGALLFAAMIIAFMLVFRQERLASGRQQRNARTDLANMMILLQTMRDLLEQQKGLARQFNAVLEKKAAGFKQQLDATMAEVEALRASVRALRVNESPSGDGEKLAAKDESSIDRTGMQTLDLPKRPHIREVERPALRVLATPKEKPMSEAVLEGWVGLDFGPESPDPLEQGVPDVPPQRPMDADAAREAFRTLLNIDGRAAKPSAPEVIQEAPQPASGNGKGKLTSVQTSVYEYSDAGMTAAEIAQELGIGRGEVRLILSLRKDRSG